MPEEDPICTGLPQLKIRLRGSSEAREGSRFPLGDDLCDRPEDLGGDLRSQPRARFGWHADLAQSFLKPSHEISGCIYTLARDSVKNYRNGVMEGGRDGGRT